MKLLRKTPYIAAFAAGVYCLKQYMVGEVCTSKARIDGKVVIVTGANTGIGKETVKDLVQRGARVYLACRSLEKAKLATEEIRKETGVSADQLPVLQLDLASLKSVREFVQDFKKKEEELHILINNAGVMWVPQGKTEDGFETVFGVNHLGHFLLTNLLMDSLASGPESRIVNVSSIAHESGKMNFDDLMLEKNYSKIQAYSQSKLANVLFTRELAKKLQGTKITVYALHPGMVNTEITRESRILSNTIIRTILYYLTWPIHSEPWNGAQTTIHCAVDEKLAGQSGKYYSDCKEKVASPSAQDDESARKLWDISIKLVKLDESETHPLLK